MIPPTDPTLEIGLVLVFLAGFSLLVHKRRSLDTEGILVADFVGLLTYLLGRGSEMGGLVALGAVLVFFLAGEGATRLVKKTRAHEVRGTFNVLFNVGPGVLALAFGYPLAFFGALSAVLSDTVSSEIGPLSKHKPRMILGFAKVEPGTDGAISGLGLLAGIGGAGLMGLFYSLATGNWAMGGVVLVAGVLGNLADSVAGALLQKHEAVTNSEVNFICGLAGGVAAVLIASALGI